MRRGMRKSWPMFTDMPTLLELQMQLRRAVLGGDTAEIVAAIHGDGLDPATRVGIYRNHAFATLGASLQGTFPVVCRLVDERFFAYAAHEYLREHPPHSRCLVEYGADFADFLADFEPCAALSYLADVARFEWALNIAATVREVTPLSPVALAAIPAEQAAYVALRLQPSLTYLTSPWPIDAIWRAKQHSEVSTVGLASGGISLQVRRGSRLAAPRPGKLRVSNSARRRLRARCGDGGGDPAGPRLRSRRGASACLRRGACYRLLPVARTGSRAMIARAAAPAKVAAVPLVDAPPKPHAHRKLGLRTALTGLVLLTVAVTAILIHLTWFYAAQRNVADVVGQLNRQIVGSVQHEVRSTLNDAWSVQEAVRSIFFQEAIKQTDEAKREFIFLALLRSHPTLSWIALGFPDGAFFGALKAADDEIDMVEVKRNPETGIRQQRVDTYTPQPGDVLFRGREITSSDYQTTAQVRCQR